MEYYLPVLLIVALFLVRIREFAVKRRTIKGPIKEKKSFMLLFLGGFFVVLGSIIEYFVLAKSPSYVFMITGTVITLAAFALRNWGIRTLGEFWSVHVEIRDNHKLIDSGPFKRIRHPVYTAAILEAVGIVTISQAYLSSLLILLVIIPAVFFRISIEEKELHAKFGEQYRDYIQQTGSLFPKIF